MYQRMVGKFWRTSGHAVVNSNFARLTPDRQVRVLIFVIENLELFLLLFFYRARKEPSGLAKHLASHLSFAFSNLEYLDKGRIFLEMALHCGSLNNRFTILAIFMALKRNSSVLESFSIPSATLRISTLTAMSLCLLTMERRLGI